MAKSFLTNINMNQNELVNAVIQNNSSAPTSPIAGQLWFDTSTGQNALKYYDGTNWISASDAPVTDVQVNGTGKVVNKVANIVLNDFGVTASAENINTVAGSGITADKVSGYDSHLTNSTIHVTAENKTAWNAKYDKPATGIPSTDLSAGVTASLAKADSAVQSVSLASGTNDGTLKLTVDGSSTDNIAVKGLKSAAFAESSAFDAAGAATTAESNANAYTDTKIQALDGSITGSAGASKTLTSFSETDGIVTATFGDIAILNTQVSGLGDAAVKGVATTVSSSSEDLVTSKAVSEAIAELPQAMIFRGTVGTGGTVADLPAASATTEGDVYKVITDGTYAGKAAKVGDTFICGKMGTDTYEWVLVKGSDTDTDTWRNIKVNGTEILGSGISTGAVNFAEGTAIDVSASEGTITIKHDNVGTAAASGFYKFETNAQGHVSNTTAVAKSDITALGIPGQDTTYTFTQDTTDGHKITLTPSSGTATTITIPDNDTTYTASSPITLSGTTFGHATSGATAGSYGPSADVTGAVVNIPYLTVDANGHITSVVNHTFTPSSDAKKANKTVTFSNAKTASIEIEGATEAFANVQVYDGEGNEVIMDVKQAFANSKITITFTVAKASSNSYTAVCIYK